MLKIQIGELDIEQAYKDYEDEKKHLFGQFEAISHKGKMLRKYCGEYTEYASDKDEKEMIATTDNQIGSFLRTVSSR